MGAKPGLWFAPTSAMRANRVYFRLVLCLAAAVLAARCARGPDDADVRRALTDTLHTKQAAFEREHSKRARRVWQETRRFYDTNGMHYAWSDGRSVRSAVDGLQRAIRAADREG